MAYKYSAMDASSQVVSGYVDAGDEVAAEEALGQQGYRVLTLKAYRTAPTLKKLMPSFFRVKVGQIIIMSRQLAALLEAGIDIVAGIEILKEQAPSGSVKSLFDDMAKKLRAGNQLGAVLHQFPSVFPPT
ncbi:MAG: type II secretion system F family protein, partial [Dehalococcoidia bacterium]|nr:type II secretion system F family protein [Dehalococcoidia bacterium]